MMMSDATPNDPVEFDTFVRDANGEAIAAVSATSLGTDAGDDVVEHVRDIASDMDLEAEP